MEYLKNWSIKRSGPAMTIEAESPNGSPRRVANIVSVRIEDGALVALGHDGEKYQLSLDVDPVDA